MNQLFIDGVAVKVCLEPISAKTLRVSVLPADMAVLDVFSTLDLDDRAWREPAIVLTELHAAAEIPYCDENGRQAGAYTAALGADFSVAIAKDGRPVQTLRLCPQTGAVSFPMGNGHIFGLGHGYDKHFDRKGARYDLKLDGQIDGIVENYSATSPTPLVISTEGWALYFHQPWKGVIDLSGARGVVRKNPMEPLPYADIFVIDAAAPEDATREYYAFTGAPPLPPKYAFGFQQSYRTLVHKGVNYVEKTARYMREHDIPCDMLVYLGTGYCKHGWNVYNGVFDWHPEVFPEPEKTMDALHEMGYKINLHITKCHTGLHGRIDDENVSPLDYDHVKNYWQKHIKLYGQAKNECWWPDDADEVDMRARLARWRMYYEGCLQLNPDVRPFQMQRNTFPGANKWGGIIWSGDIIAEWETLKNQVPIGLNVALSCSPFWGSDTGGFFTNPEFDGELFIRWFQYSAFTPFIRAHGRPSFLHNLWGWTLFTPEDDIPMEQNRHVPRDGPPHEGAFPDTRVQPICRDYLHLRYALLPYIYNLAKEAANGLPMMRPMWFKYPHDAAASGLGSQYMLGDSLLVAPVTAKGAERWPVYFPEGVYYSLWTGEKITGGGCREVEAGLDTIPVYVPAGGILAKGPRMQYVDTAIKDDFDPLTLEIYSGRDGSYTLYEDDGISQGYLRGEYTETRFNWDDSAGRLTAQGTSTLFPGRSREIAVRLMPSGERFALTIEY